MAFSVKRLLPVPRSRRLARARAASAARDWASSARHYAGYLARNPDDFGQWVQYGHALKESGDIAGAETAYHRARCLRHLDADLLLNMGHLYKTKGDMAVAYNYYRMSYEIDGNSRALLELTQFPANRSPDMIGDRPLTTNALTDTTRPLVREAIQASGLFDEKWYATEYLGEAIEEGDDADEDPLDHFVRRGIKAGNDPSPHFSIEGYRIANADVANSTSDPFLHYLWIGRGERRPLVYVEPGAREKARKALPDLFALKQRERTARIAVVAHVYYTEIWDEISNLLPNIVEGFDIYISLIEDVSDHIRDNILKSYPNAHILVFPNHGRDCFPFTEFLRAGALDSYEMVCKLHTKRSLHRIDGDKWRDELYTGLLGSADTVDTIVSAMRSDPDIGIFVPEGHIYSTEYLGSNIQNLQQLLDRVGLRFDMSNMRFPSGNMFWISAACVQYLKILNLDFDDYEVEAKQLDGTTAHALERFAGMACVASGQRIVSMPDILGDTAPPYGGDRHRLIAFYLPQFHPIAENDRWWGKGFTEWHNLQNGKPYYVGHNQPRRPSELGYYDLRIDDVRTEQAELARAYGVEGFCYYHYWFDGKTLLDLPLRRLIESDLDYPFCLCWANENWTRSWDGLNKDVLLPQTYDPVLLRRYASDIAPYLRDRRYIRHDGKPLFLIYKIMDIPEVADRIAEWREIWRQEGIGEVHVAAVRTFAKDPVKRPQDLNLDAWVDFPPQSLARYAQGAAVAFTEAFSGLIYDYQKATEGDLARYDTEDSTLVHRGVMGCWDNTARRGPNAHIAHGASPITYRNWLRKMMVQDAEAHPTGERLIFINAWNEWAEGTYLEPDQRYGRAFLEATRSVRPIDRSRNAGSTPVVDA